MAKFSHRKIPFRECISADAKEVAIFATDVLTQPQFSKYAHMNPHVFCKCSRALPIAKSNDIVVLTGSLEPQYYQWLRGIGFGPETVIEYRYHASDVSLTDIILGDLAPIHQALEREQKKAVLVPFYSGHKESVLAESLGVSLFGSDTEICKRYFNKASFKRICVELGIPTVSGSSFSMNDTHHTGAFEQLVSAVLSNYGKVIIRGEFGSSGSSLYQADCSSRLPQLYDQIRANDDGNLLIEPMLKVVASPNDQWIIDREGKIHHLGMSAQLFKELAHAGNLKGQYFSGKTYKYITSVSRKIVRKMADDGYTGALGIDYIVTEEGIFPIENNARLNGSSFVYGIVDRVEEQIGSVPCWKFFKARTQPGDFHQLADALGTILYSGKQLNRVFPFDCDMLALNGEFTAVLLAEDMYHIDYLEEALTLAGIERVH
ncbi:MAG: hypothetical protein KDD62_00575 [Bdellovibrionales bacterium]|nr:hypothetical protein [Bdellovibrionales bacterium]